MRFLELMVAGVPGTQGPVRLPLEPGWNLWKAKGSFRPDGVVDLLTDLLYPAPIRGGLPGPGRAQQAELTFEARGSTYQVHRDYGRGATRLSQLEPGRENTFREISHDLRFVQEALLRSVQAPPQRVFRSLFVARLSDTLLPPERSGMTRKEELASRAEEDPGRLEGLRKELATHRRIAEGSARLDELQAALFGIDEQLARLEEPRRKREQLEQEYEEYRVLDEPGVLSPQLIPKLQAYEEQREKRKTDLTELDEREVALDAALTGISDRPSWKEAPVGVGAVLAPAGFAAIGFARGSAWLFGLSWAAFFAGLVTLMLGWFRGRARLERREKLKKEIRDLEAERAGVEKRFEIETALCRKFFADVGNEDPEDLLGMLQRHASLSEEIRKGDEAWQKLLDEVPEKRKREEREALLREIAEVERRLGELPPVTGDLNSVQREIARLESGTEKGGETGDDRSALPIFPEGDEPNRLVSLAAEAVGRSPGELLAHIREGMSANLASISAGRFRKGIVRGGRILGFVDAEGRDLQWDSRNADDRAVLLFAVQFTLWQAVALGTHPRPVVIDATRLPAIEDPLFKTAWKAGEFLSAKTQVLVLGG